MMDVLLTFGGAALIAVGAGMVYRPAGFIAAGALALYLGALHDLVVARTFWPSRKASD
jgi:hypothetical protein